MKRPDFVVFDFDFEKGDVFVDTKSRSSRHKDLILDEEREVKKYMPLSGTMTSRNGTSFPCQRRFIVL